MAWSYWDSAKEQYKWSTDNGGERNLLGDEGERERDEWMKGAELVYIWCAAVAEQLNVPAIFVV